jgi:agmatinase
MPPHLPPDPTLTDYASVNGWDRDYATFDSPDAPTYTGPVTYCARPMVEDPVELTRRRPDVAIVGAPFDEAVSYRPGARFGPRAIRQATYTNGGYSLQLDVEPFEFVDVVDAGDAAVVPAWLEQGHAMIFRKVLDVARSGAVPIILGGDHSITWPSVSAIAQVWAPRRIGVVHFDAHADTADNDYGVLAGHGTPMRRLIESGAVLGRNFVQVGLRGYWPPPDVFAWMHEQGMRWHLMREIEERGAEAVIDQAITEALDGPDAIYLSVDIDVVDPGMAPGTGTPEPGGLLTRELLRAVRRIVGRVQLAGMDVVEVSPPYDHADVTAMAAHRTVLEAISALAAKRRDGATIRHEPVRRAGTPPTTPIPAAAGRA